MYCTYLTVYFGNKMPMYYIGSTSIKKFNRGYRGTPSSVSYKSIWRSELRFNPQLFKTHLLKTFETRREAFQSEEKIHKFLNVINSTLYVNMCYANRFQTYGHKHSEETKKKIGEKSKGRSKGIPRSEETKSKISNANKGRICSDHQRAAVSRTNTQRNTGVKLSDEHRANISAAKKLWWKSNKCKMVGRKRAPHSEETKAKLKASWAARKANKPLNFLK